MGSYGQNAGDSAITPGRTTTLYLDLTEPALIESAFSVTRAGAEIAADVAIGLANDTPTDDDARHSNIIHWPSGAITLRPLQNDISNLHEGVVCAPSIISVPSKMTLVQSLTATAIMAVENQHRVSDDLPDFSASSNIQPTGDPFLVKHVGAGQTFANALTDSQPAPDFVTQDIPLDRVGYSTDVYPENQGFFLRWTVPGSDVSVHGYSIAFYFGQYGLCVKGTGEAELWEYCQNYVTSNFLWHRRATWRYARAGQLSNTAHSMAIWPHSDPGGRRYISFTNNQLDQAVTASQFARTGTAYVSPGEYLYVVDQVLRSANDRDESPGKATKAGIIRFDIRRDLKVDIQISTLAWPTAGFLVDLPANIPPLADSTVPVTCYPATQHPDGTGITATLLDALDGSPYVVGTSPGPCVRFDFTGNGQTTPILWEYRLVRDAVVTTITPGIFTAKVSSVSVTGISGDPSQDTASVVVKDPAAALTRLRQRGRFSSSLVVEDAFGKVVLHRGTALRPASTRLGTAGRVYPSPDWRRFKIPLAPMSQRLSERFQGPQQRKYQHDGNAIPDASGNYPPWKVTDNVYDLLSTCGYLPQQINIPDLEIRLWPGEGVKADDYILDAAGDILEYLCRLVRDMLGGYLIYDPNAGVTDVNGLPIGQWQILFQTPYNSEGTFDPIYNFVTGPDFSGPGANITPPHVLSAYPIYTAPIFGHVDFEIVPPEYNSVLVTSSVDIYGTPVKGAVYSYYYNYNSFQAPGSTTPLDPSNPDYLGYERRMIIADATIAGDAPLDQAQYATDWVARRYYDFSCHSQYLCHFKPPLVFVQDPLGGYRRPLRFQDPISINGDTNWLVKACHPGYTKDAFQFCEIEAIRPNGNQSVPAGIDSVSNFRTAQSRHAQKSTGANTQGQRFARKTTPPHREQQHFELPSLVAYQAPQQDPSTGAPYFMLGYSLLGGPDLLR